MWDLLVDDRERMIADSVRTYLAKGLPIARLRTEAARSDMLQVSQMAELGWFGVGLPEDVGGSGLGLIEEMLVQRECGRYLISPSVLATVLAAHVAFHAGDTALSAAFVEGRKSASLGIPAASPSNDPGLAYAFDWNGSDPLLLWNEDGMGLFDPSGFGEAQVEECLDESLTMHAGLLSLRRPVHWINAKQQSLVLRAQVLLAASLVGVAEQTCDLTVEYVKVREQFGKPIGAFQAVKHRCADMAVRWRLAWYQTSLACLKVQANARDAPLQSAAAKLTAAHAAHENARAAIQMHGGMGYQSECDVHRFMKRCHIYEQAGGNMQVQARRVAAEPSPLE
jgi:alkylation response protein AidB-like acyl-CoA dehydrogenase